MAFFCSVRLLTWLLLLPQAFCATIAWFNTVPETNSVRYACFYYTTTPEGTDWVSVGPVAYKETTYTQYDVAAKGNKLYVISRSVSSNECPKDYTGRSRYQIFVFESHINTIGHVDDGTYLGKNPWAHKITGGNPPMAGLNPATAYTPPADRKALMLTIYTNLGSGNSCEIKQGGEALGSIVQYDQAFAFVLEDASNFGEIVFECSGRLGGTFVYDGVASASLDCVTCGGASTQIALVADGQFMTITGKQNCHTGNCGAPTAVIGAAHRTWLGAWTSAIVLLVALFK